MASPRETITNHYAHNERVPLRSQHHVAGISDINQHGRATNNLIVAESNEVTRFELFMLGEGEKKVFETPDTRTPNTSMFTFNKEDHTLANLLRGRLLKDPRVLFSGYKVPHPLFATFELRIQTNGDLTPKEVLIQNCRELVQELGQLSREFTKEFELRKMVAGDGVRD